jgi:hypothetical protein
MMDNNGLQNASHQRDSWNNNPYSSPSGNFPKRPIPLWIKVVGMFLSVVYLCLVFYSTIRSAKILSDPRAGFENQILGDEIAETLEMLK